MARDLQQRQLLEELQQVKAPRLTDPLAQPCQLLAVNEWSDVFLLADHNELIYVNLAATDNSGLLHVVFEPPQGSTSRPSIPPDIAISGLEFAPDGESLLVWGEYYAALVKLPHRSRFGDIRLPERSASSSTRKGDGFELTDLSGYAVDDLGGPIVDAKWHPMSSGGCVALLVDCRKIEPQLLLYCLANLPKGAHGGPVKPTQKLMLGQLNSDEPNLTAIKFGNGDSGWDRFAAYIVDHNGDISVLCPVVPEDATLPRAVVVDLLSSIEDQIDELEATGVGQPADNSGRVEQSNSGAQQTRWNEKRILQDQWDWITNVFGLSLGGGDGYSSEEDVGVSPVRSGPQRTLFGSAERRTAGRMRRSSSQSTGERGRHGRGGWVQVSKAEHLHANLPTLQDQVCTVQQSADALAEEISSSATVACSLAHLTGPHGGLVADKDGPLGGSVALARAFTSGHVDVLLLIGGPQPQWAERIDSEGPEERRLMTQSVVVECITLQDAGEASGGGGSGGPMLLVDPCDQDTMHVVLPHRIVMLRIKCLEQLRQWCLAVPKLAAETGQGQGVGGGRQLYSTPAPGARGGLVPDGLGDLEKSVVVEIGQLTPGTSSTLVGAAVLATPVLGHLMLTRETGGPVEIINITAVAAQAEAEAKLTSKLQELQPPSSAARLAAAAGDMTQPYQEVLAVACQDIDGALRRSRALLQGVDAAVAGRRVDEGDEAAVTALMQASEALQEGALATLEAAQVAAVRRMHVLMDAHQYQHQQLRQLEELLAQAAAKQAALLQKQAGVEELSENLLARAAEALSMAQALQPRRTSAEAAYEAELQRWQSQRARWGQIVQRLKQVATDEAAAEDAALASSGQGLKLTQQQHSTLVALLRDEAQHLQQSSQKLHQVRDGLKGVALS